MEIARAVLLVNEVAQVPFHTATWHIVKVARLRPLPDWKIAIAGVGGGKLVVNSAAAPLVERLVKSTHQLLSVSWLHVKEVAFATFHTASRGEEEVTDFDVASSSSWKTELTHLWEASLPRVQKVTLDTFDAALGRKHEGTHTVRLRSACGHTAGRVNEVALVALHTAARLQEEIANAISDSTTGRQRVKKITLIALDAAS